MANLKYISSFIIFGWTGGIKWTMPSDFLAKKKQLSFYEGLRPIAASIKEGLLLLRWTIVLAELQALWPCTWHDWCHKILQETTFSNMFQATILLWTVCYIAQAFFDWRPMQLIVLNQAKLICTRNITYYYQYRASLFILFIWLPSFFWGNDSILKKFLW